MCKRYSTRLSKKLSYHHSQLHVPHSTTNSLLPISRHKLSQVQNSSFRSVGPRLWNTLSTELHEEQNLETFKSKLKTVLFQKCYD